MQVLNRDGTLHVLLRTQVGSSTIHRFQWNALKPSGSSSVGLDADSFDLSRDGSQYAVLSRRDDRFEIRTLRASDGSKLGSAPCDPETERVFFLGDQVVGITRRGAVSWLLPAGTTRSPIHLGVSSRTLSTGDHTTGIYVVESASALARILKPEGAVSQFPLQSAEIEMAKERFSLMNAKNAASGSTQSFRLIALAAAGGPGLLVLVTGHPVAEGFPVVGFDSHGNRRGMLTLKIPGAESKPFHPAFMQVAGDHLLLVNHQGDTHIFNNVLVSTR